MRQAAYRKNHSTETALLSVVDGLLRNADDRLVLLLALLDLSTALTCWTILYCCRGNPNVETACIHRSNTTNVYWGQKQGYSLIVPSSVSYEFAFLRSQNYSVIVCRYAFIDKNCLNQGYSQSKCPRYYKVILRPSKCWNSIHPPIKYDQNVLKTRLLPIRVAEVLHDYSQSKWPVVLSIMWNPNRHSTNQSNWWN